MERDAVERAGAGWPHRDLHELSVAMMGILDLRELARLIAEHARELLQADAVTIYEWDDDAAAPTLSPLYTDDPSGGTPGSIGPGPGQGVARQALEQREAVVVRDYATWEHALPGAVARGVRAAVGVPFPLLAPPGGRPFGALALGFLTPRACGPDEIDALSLFAAHVTPTLEAVRLYVRSERRRLEAETLAELVRIGAPEPDTDRVIRLITERACGLLSADYAGLVVIGADGTRAWSGIWGNRSDAWRTVKVQGGRSATSQALGSGRTVIAEVGRPTDAPVTHAELHESEGGRTVLATPLLTSERALGVLTVGWRSDVAPTSAQIRLAETLASYAATILNHARVHAREQEVTHEATARAAQQAAVAELGRRALSGAELTALLDEAVRLVARTLGVEYCTVLELLPGGSTLLTRAGVGREQPASEQATLSADGDPQAAYTIRAHEPVIADDLEAETRFDGSSLARAHGVKSGMSVLIQTREGPFGVLTAYAADRRAFTEEGVNFLQAIAHVVAAAIERRRSEEALEHQALHDALTGLPNRTLFHDRLRQAMLSAQRDHDGLALLLLDLDRFKEVNDTLGHQCGDTLLQQVGQRLRGALRAVDTVARLGGDEFAVVVPTARDVAGATLVADKVRQALEAPFSLDGYSLDVSTSIGIAVCPEHGDDAGTLLRRADVALYVAKRTGSGYAVYASEHDEHTPDRLALVGELRRAIEQDELVLHYQPTVDYGTRHVTGVEALVRWQHPQRGLVSPDSFIPLAEQTGLVKPLSRQVLNAALRQCQAWLQAGLQIPVAVNLSMRNVHDPGLPDTIVELLQTWSVPPAYLKVEITESTLMADPVRAMQVLLRLRDMGLWIAIDDFGTGYSSLAYLKRLPVNQLKIDRSFVKDMTADENDFVIVRSTIDLSHNLGLTVIAEGVEDQATWDLLAALGCDEAQGYFLSRPLPMADLALWLDGKPEASGHSAVRSGQVAVSRESVGGATQGSSEGGGKNL